jgi:hypothetical protein
MSFLGLLSFRQPDQDDRFTGLRALADETGISVEEVHLTQISPGLAGRLRSQITRLLDEAAGWIVVTEYHAISQLHSLGLFPHFRDRMVNGGRFLLSLPENHLDEANALAAPFDVTGTNWRIRRRDVRDAYSLAFTRSRDHFRDATLLTGVDKVMLHTACALWYAGDALPVLSFGRDPADDDLLMVRGRTDFPLTDFTWQELTPLVVSQTDQNGCLLASSSIGIVSDPATTVMGLDVPGVEANRQFARNMLRFLTLPGGSPRQTVQDKLHALEVNLAEFVKGVGEAAWGAEWWVRLVSEQDRMKCDARRRGSIQPIGCLDLVDFRRIIASNWEIFLPYLSSVLGNIQSKTQGLAWLDVIPSIRNAVAHPVREHFGAPLKDSDRAAVYHAARIANELRMRVKRT